MKTTQQNYIANKNSTMPSKLGEINLELAYVFTHERNKEDNIRSHFIN